jgi:hypothetical protein
MYEDRSNGKITHEVEEEVVGDDTRFTPEKSH